MSRPKGGNYLIDLTSCGVIETNTIIDFSNLNEDLKKQIYSIFEDNLPINDKQIKIICENNLFDDNVTHSIITINAYKYGGQILSDLIPNSQLQGSVSRIIIDNTIEKIRVNKYQY